MRLVFNSDFGVGAVLAAIHRLEGASAPEIAASSGLPVGKIEALLAILAGQGYVEEAPGPTGCRGCPLQGNCGGRRWKLTRKGEEAIRHETAVGTIPG